MSPREAPTSEGDKEQRMKISTDFNTCVSDGQGQITVFSVIGCPHCLRLKALLKRKNYSFVEIDLSAFPERRTGMILLCNSPTVPQLFFNNFHIGNADEVEELEAAEELDSLHDQYIIRNSFAYKFAPPTIATSPARDEDRSRARARSEDQTLASEKRFRSVSSPGRVAYNSCMDYSKAQSVTLSGIEAIEASESPSLSVFLTPTRPLGGQNRLQPRLQDRDSLYTGVYELKEQGEARVYSYADLVRRLLEILDIRDRRKSLLHRPTQRRCFLGNEAVSSFATAFGFQSREEAVQLGNTLMEANVFQQVSQSVDTFRDRPVLYRLQYHEDPHTLNTAMVWTQHPAYSFSVLQHINRLFHDLEAQFTDGEIGSVDYVAIAADRKYLDFQIATCELQQVDMLRESDNARLAFFINLYNIAVKHALVQFGLPVDNFARIRFSATVGYCVGGFRYSLNDIEHGILRGNKRPPYMVSKPFRFKDQREDLAMSNVDVRIHFALNCGAKSCPPIHFYTAENVQEELRIAAEAFCEDPGNMEVDSLTRTIFLSKIFHWYESDFSGSAGFENPEALLQLAKLCSARKRTQLENLVHGAQGKRIRVKFRNYDWSPKNGNYRRFKK